LLKFIFRPHLSIYSWRTTLTSHYRPYSAPHCGSGLVNPKGKHLYKTLIKATNKLDHVSFGSPTYWASDLDKLPDLIDFAVTKNISRSLVRAECLQDLSSDHSPVLTFLSRYEENVKLPYRPTSHRTNWPSYKLYISSHIELNPNPILNLI